MQIDPDYWEEWKSHPLTEALFKAFIVWASDEQQKWMSASWGQGQSDPMVLNTHRSRAVLLEQLAEMTRDKLEEAHEQDSQSH